MSALDSFETTPATRVRFGLHAGGQVEVWRSPARFKVIVAGRRWGKTNLVRTWLLARALNGKPGRYWYVGPTREDAKDIMWADLKEAADPRWLSGPPREVDLALTLRGGREIRIWSAEKDSGLKGRRLRALVMDEYADMDPAVFSEVLRPSLADFRAPAMFIGTPKSHNHFYDFYLRGQDPAFPQWASWQFHSTANPFMDAAEIAEARATTDPRTFRQEWEASFESLAGRAYYAFSRATHVKPVTLDRSLPVCVSFDFNYHPATAVIGQKVGDEARVWREVWVEHAGGEATKASAEGARALLQAAGYTGQVRLYGDATGTSAKTTGPSDHAVIKETFPGAVWCLRTHNPNPRDRVAAVNARCETQDGRVHFAVDPSCVQLIRDFDRVVFAKNGELDQKSEGSEMLTHISDACGYWIHVDFPVVRPRVAAGHARIERLL